LVAIESLASGTPVIAWRRGALPELIREGITGAIVDDEGEAVAALARLDEFDRMKCRAEAESRFGIAAMTRGYLDAYQIVLSQAISRRRSSTSTFMNRTPSSAKP
jgi:glycosyltransferase involved in cell wall biosynthesis